MKGRNKGKIITSKREAALKYINGGEINCTKLSRIRLIRITSNITFKGTEKIGMKMEGIKFDIILDIQKKSCVINSHQCTNLSLRTVSSMERNSMGQPSGDFSLTNQFTFLQQNQQLIWKQFSRDWNSFIQ